MFTVNGSVKTIGPDNWLPIDALYEFKRYSCKFLLHLDENQDQLEDESYQIIDKSPYHNLINHCDINPMDISQENFIKSHYFGARSFSFNGTSSYIFSNCNNGIVLDKSNFTISIWINTQYYSFQNGSPRYIFLLGDTIDQLAISLQDSSGNASANPSVIIYNNGTKSIIYNTTYNCCDGKWHHLLITRDVSNVIRYFIDGFFVNKITNNVNLGWNQKTASLYIGCYSNQSSGFYLGLVDELYILSGICEKLTDDNFDDKVPQVPYFVAYPSEKNYSGMVFHAKIGQNISKYDLLFYHPGSRTYRVSDALDKSTLPVQGIALESGKSGDTIEVLAYGTIASNVNDFLGEETEYTSLLPVLSSTTSYELNSLGYAIHSTSGDANYLFNANKIDQKYIWNTTYWTPGVTTNNISSWIRIKLYSPQCVKKYIISANSSAPLGWKLKGSNDKIHWILLDSQINLTWTAKESKEFLIPNNNDSYQYYELFDLITPTEIGELQFYDENNKCLIPRVLISDSTNNYDYIEVKTSSTAGEITGHEAYHLFDGDINTYWQPGGSNIVGDILIDFGMWYEPNVFEVAKVDKFAINCDANKIENKQIYVPFEFVILGSDHNNADESTWNLLYEYKINDQSESVWQDYNDRAVFELNNDNQYYRYYKFSIKKSDILKPFSCTTDNVPVDFRLTSIELLDNANNKINLNGTSPKTKIYRIKKYKVTDTASSSDNPSYTIFDNKTISRTLGWVINSSFSPVSVTLDLNDSEWIKQYTIWPKETNSSNLNTLNATPKSWKLYGSNNNSTWDLLDSYTDSRTDISSDSSEIIRTLSSSVNYRYFKFEILNTFNPSLGLHLYKITFKNAISQELDLPVFTSSTTSVNTNYFNPYRANVNIRTSDELNNQYNSIRNIVNDIFTFNICSQYDYQWITNNNIVTPWIIFDLPDLIHTNYDRKINGYTLVSLINVNDHEVFRSPLSWVVRGFDALTHNWIELDRQTNIHFRNHLNCFNELDSGSVKLDFQLSETYDNLTKIQLEILQSEGSTTKMPPSFIGLKNFYPTFDGQILEIPRFTNSHIAVTNEEKYLNHYYFGNKDFNIEVSSSSQSTNLGYLFEENLSQSWKPGTDLAEITTAQLDVNSHSLGSIDIVLNASKRIVGYGIFYSLLALCGMKLPATKWTLKGSNDGVNWDILDRVGLITTDMVLKSYPMIFDINTEKSYKFYKFDDLNGGYLHGIELYELNTIKESKALTLSLNNPGKLSTKELIKNYNRRKINSYYVQNLGYTELNFNTADEEYSVKYFDFNKQLEVIDPNLGDVIITPDTSDPYYGGVGHSIENGPMVTLLFNSLEILDDAILTTKVPCRGLQIVVLHDCLINGTISMTNKGAAYSPRWVNDFPIYDHLGNLLDTIPRYGGNGGIFTPLEADIDKLDNWKQGAASATVYQSLRQGVNGKDGSTIIDNMGNARRATGGGGSGSAICYLKTLLGKAGDGGRGSCFSGGAGGSGLYLSNIGVTSPNPYRRYTAIPAFNDATYSGSSFCSNNNRIYGCNTSTGYTGTAASGTIFRANGAGPRLGSCISGGANAYTTMYPTAAPALTANGAGGLIILIVYGNLYTGLSGKIQANGSQPQSAYMPACGGGSGGGSINIFVGGIHINNGIYEAIGGAGGIGTGVFANAVNATNASYVPGGAGGNGVVTISRL